jgi:hypothetical protein
MSAAHSVRSRLLHLVALLLTATVVWAVATTPAAAAGQGAERAALSALDRGLANGSARSLSNERRIPFDRRVIRFNSSGRLVAVGPMRIGQRSRLLNAYRIYGRPVRTRAFGQHNMCVATWRANQMEAYFAARRRRGAPCRNGYLDFTSAALARGWRTDRGLVAGDPASKIRELYPRARQKRNVFLLDRQRGVPRNRADELFAVTRSGRVVGFVPLRR